MPVRRLIVVSRSYVRANPKTLFLFGDNCARRGMGGQAREMRGEPNAVGIRTKRRPGRADADYFTDADYDEAVVMIDADLSPVYFHLMRGGDVVLPEAGIGTGLAEMPSRCPLIFGHLQRALDHLEHHA